MRSTEGGTIQDIEVRLDVGVKYGNIVNTICKMNRTEYRPVR